MSKLRIALAFVMLVALIFSDIAMAASTAKKTIEPLALYDANDTLIGRLGPDWFIGLTVGENVVFAQIVPNPTDRIQAMFVGTIYYSNSNCTGVAYLGDFFRRRFPGISQESAAVTTPAGSFLYLSAANALPQPVTTSSSLEFHGVCLPAIDSGPRVLVEQIIPLNFIQPYTLR